MIDAQPPVQVECVQAAAQRYNVPELLLYSIIYVEKGAPGVAKRNTDGSYDLGRAQINTYWLKKLSAYNITADHLLWSDCWNVGIGAWILRSNYEQYQDWTKAIIAYNIGSKWTHKKLDIGVRYANKVLVVWNNLYQNVLQRVDKKQLYALY